MNKVMLMGRLTREPDIRYSQGENAMAIARYTLAVDRRFSRSGNGGNDQSADFISCVAFGRSAEFAEKYLHQGTKIVVTGRIQTGSYTGMVRRYIPPMLWWRIRSLQRARALLHRTAEVLLTVRNPDPSPAVRSMMGL